MKWLAGVALSCSVVVAGCGSTPSKYAGTYGCIVWEEGGSVRAAGWRVWDLTIKADGAAYLSNIFIDSTKREQFVLNPYRDPEPWHWEERNGEFLLGRDQGDVLWKGRLNGRTLHIDGAMFGIDLERRHP